MKNSLFKKMAVVALAAAVTLSSVGTQAAAKGSGYKFKNKGVTVQIDSAAKTFINKAGKPEKTTVKKSCAYKGKDRTYQYKNFILGTYSKTANGAEYVQSITFRTASVKTAEGIKIGSAEKDVVAKYGKKYDATILAINNIYAYKKGNCTLQIQVKSGKVKNIRYLQTKVK